MTERDHYRHRNRCRSTYCRRNKMVAISRRRSLHVHFLEWRLEFQIKFHRNMFICKEFTIGQHWCRQWYGSQKATSHCLVQFWPSSQMHIGVTGPQCVSQHRPVIRYNDHNHDKLWHADSLPRKAHETIECRISVTIARGPWPNNVWRQTRQTPFHTWY